MPQLIDKSRFKNGSGVFFTKSLFFETNTGERDSVVYTLKDADHLVDGVLYPSLYKLYMESNDPTEWKFANEHLFNWAHWEELNKCNWFKEYVERWRRELDLRMKSQALARIMSESKTTSREALAANKYLLERGWEPKDTKGRGRPSKDEIKAAAKTEAEKLFRVEDDFSRIITPGVRQ